MIKITCREIAQLTGKSEGYIRVLLHRKGLRIKPEYFSDIFDLIQKYRGGSGAKKK